MSDYIKSLFLQLLWKVLSKLGIEKPESSVVSEAAQAAEVTEEEVQAATRKMNIQFEESEPEKKVTWFDRLTNKWNAACYGTWRFVSWPARALVGLLDFSIGCVMFIGIMIALAFVASATGIVWYPVLCLLIAEILWMRKKEKKANSWWTKHVVKIETFIGGVILVGFLTLITGGCALGIFIFFGFAWLMLKFSRRFTKKSQLPVTDHIEGIKEVEAGK